jgi:predicted transcriptional regulator
MTDDEHILISLESRHADRIYAGTKRVELRRRPINVLPGTRVWIYEKVPVGSITGSARVKAVHIAAPTKLWQEFGNVSGLSRSEFFDYFSNVTNACALVLQSATPVKRPMPLSTLRELAHGFQPPQFFLRLDRTHPLCLAMAASSKTSKARTTKKQRSVACSR